MSTTYDSPPVGHLRHDLSTLRGNWLWFVLLGIGLIVLGVVALGAVVIASLATAIIIGILLLIGGVSEVIGAFWCHGWSGYFLHLLSGILSIVVGVLFVWSPVAALVALTLLLACLLLVSGFFKIIAALSHRFAAWGWPLLSGIIDVILGALIWWQWPESALWVLGLFVGISLIFRGAAWIGLGIALRGFRRPETHHGLPPVAP